MRAWLETKLGEVGGHPGFTEFWLQVKGHEDEWPKPTCLEIREVDDPFYSRFWVKWDWEERVSAGLHYHAAIIFVFGHGWRYETIQGGPITAEQAHRGLCALTALKTVDWRSKEVAYTDMKTVDAAVRK